MLVAAEANPPTKDPVGVERLSTARRDLASAATAIEVANGLETVAEVAANAAEAQSAGLAVIALANSLKKAADPAGFDQ